MIGSSRAREILARIGWLARQPEAFRAEVFRRAVPVRFAAGQVVYRMDDPPGGIYGVVGGTLVASADPARQAPSIIHLMTPGSWTGEAPFISREPRRIELRAAIDSAAIYLPLDAMEQMAGADPQATRRFAQILLMSVDITMRAFHDLQEPDEHRRIALALRRVAAPQNTPLPLSQATLGILANTSRKTVNAALKRFEKNGWVKRGYRAVTITDLAELTRFGEQGAD